MKNKYLYLITAIIIILCGYLFLKPKIKTVKEDKPTLIVRYINQPNDDEIKPGKIDGLFFGILGDRYNLVVDQKAQDYDIIVAGPFGNKSIPNNRAVKIYWTGEAFLPNLKDFDLVIGFDLIEADNYIRMPLYYSFFSNDVSTTYKRPGRCNPNKPYFACFLYTNGGNSNDGINLRNHLPFDGCAKRNRLFHLLSLYKEVKSGGKYLNNIGTVIPYEDTKTWLSNCKFVIAYENQSWNGYITEKPFQAYFTGSVPIYYADPSALGDINTKAVILANDFVNESDLVEYIKKVDQDDALYCDIWNQKMSIDPDKNFEVIREKLRVKLEKIVHDKLNK